MWCILCHDYISLLSPSRWFRKLIQSSKTLASVALNHVLVWQGNKQSLFQPDSHALVKVDEHNHYVLPCMASHNLNYRKDLNVCFVKGRKCWFTIKNWSVVYVIKSQSSSIDSSSPASQLSPSPSITIINIPFGANWPWFPFVWINFHQLHL